MRQRNVIVIHENIFAEKTCKSLPTIDYHTGLFSWGGMFIIGDGMFIIGDGSLSTVVLSI